MSESVDRVLEYLQRYPQIEDVMSNLVNTEAGTIHLETEALREPTFLALSGLVQKLWTEQMFPGEGRGLSVTEFGFGNGYFRRRIIPNLVVPHVNKWTGVEISPIAYEQFNTLPLPSGFEHIKDTIRFGNFFNTKLPNDSSHIVLAANALDSIKNIQGALTEAARIARRKILIFQDIFPTDIYKDAEHLRSIVEQTAMEMHIPIEMSGRISHEVLAEKPEVLTYATRKAQIGDLYALCRSPAGYTVALSLKNKLPMWSHLAVTSNGLYSFTTEVEDQVKKSAESLISTLTTNGTIERWISNHTPLWYTQYVEADATVLSTNYVMQGSSQSQYAKVITNNLV